jgi:hypothetical protein
MTTTVKIDMSNPLALPLVNYLEKLPFASVEKKGDKTFEQACAECGAVSVDEFIDELRRQVNEHYDQIENA